MKGLLVLVVLLYTTTSVYGCGGYLNAKSGYVVSPNYPTYYSTSSYCQWIITVEEGSIVRLTVIELKTGDCWYDYLVVYDGPSTQYQWLKAFCSSVTPPASVLISSSNNSVTLLYRSTASSSKKGLKAYYQTLNLSGCGGTLVDNNGTFTSPGYPESYTFLIKCTWVIKVTVGYNITLVVTDLDMEDSHICMHDSMKIYDGPDETYPEMGLLCGHDLPDPNMFTSTSNTMSIVMASDQRVNGRGFAAEYGIVNGTSNAIGCGGTLVDNNGTFTSPGYPESYTFLTKCTWVIKVTVGYNITLVVTDLDMENSHICMHDSVKIYDGPDDTYPELGILCGNALPDPNMFTSTSNIMSIVMASDQRVNGRGFAAEYGIGNGISNAIIVTNPPPESNAEGQSYGAALLAFVACHVVMMLF